MQQILAFCKLNKNRCRSYWKPLTCWTAMHSTYDHCWVVQIQEALYITQENISEEHQESKYPTMHYVSSVKNNFFVCKKCSNFPGSTASWSPVQKFCHTSPGLHVLFSAEGTFFLSWHVSNRTCGFVGQRILVNFRDVCKTAKTLSLWCGLMHRRAYTKLLTISRHTEALHTSSSDGATLTVIFQEDDTLCN